MDVSLPVTVTVHFRFKILRQQFTGPKLLPDWCWNVMKTWKKTWNVR